MTNTKPKFSFQGLKTDPNRTDFTGSGSVHRFRFGLHTPTLIESEDLCFGKIDPLRIEQGDQDQQQDHLLRELIRPSIESEDLCFGKIDPLPIEQGDQDQLLRELIRPLIELEDICFGKIDPLPIE